MFLRTDPTSLILSLSLLLAASGAVDAKTLYRWVDEKGNVTFSDQVPPDQVQHKRDTLNDKARVVDSVEKAKTAEEWERQRRLESLRKEQEKIVAKQASSDKVLLATYRSLDDMQKVMDNKMVALDSEIKIADGNVKRYEQQLLQQQQQAADHERNARKVPEKLLADIANSKRQVEVAKQEFQRQEQRKETVTKEFKADMARFQFLTQNNVDGKNQQSSLAASNANGELGLFVCQDAEQCGKAWKVAGDFVAKFSTTGPDVQSDKLIMRAAPFEDNDISLSVSKLERDNQQQIFLDIRCKESNLGKELCASEKTQTIRQGFSGFIQLQLTTQ